MPPTSTALLVLTTLPEQASAERIAREVVENRLAACVNILAPCQSAYRWQDGLQVETEFPLQIKTTLEAYPALERYLVEHHPYELPEIVAVEIHAGLPDYLNWVVQETQVVA